MSGNLPRWLPLALIALVALWLRTHDLGRRPMHADEANQAVKTGVLLESGTYAFDPHDHHGPTLYYAALPIAWLRGEHSLAALTEITVRLVPALAGTLSVLLLAWLAAPLGRLTSTMAAVFLAVAPPAVYFSRYFIQETLLVTFSLGAFWCAQQWWRRGQLRWAIALGGCIGLMLSTKASAPLFLFAALVAALAIRPGLPASREPARAIATALLTALLVAIAFYSSFGTHFAGLRDALSAYTFAAERATVASGHEKPWWYYLEIFSWHRDGGLLFQQAAFCLAAGAGLVACFIKRQKLLRWAALYTVFVLLSLSLTPYKTPWHVIHLVPGIAILAAGGIALCRRRWIVLAVAAVVATLQVEQTKLAAFLRSSDARNPYAYVHSSPDVLKFRGLVESALQQSGNGVVRVISEEYWPLAWYLRGLPRIGFWSTPPADCDGVLVIASATQADAVRSALHGPYRESFLGLRPGFLCVVFSRVP
jgi:uncharacterized protein (TIGR03663 family)